MKKLCYLSGMLMMATMWSCGVDIPEEKLTSFETQVVEESDIEIPLKYSARLTGKGDVVISSQVNGQLMKTCVKTGEQVKKGQTIFLIDDRQAKLDLEDAKANLAAAVARENSAKLEYESNKNLFEKKIVSSYMLNMAENAYNQAKAAVAQARSAVNRAQVSLGFCTITSPIDGIIGEIPASTGMQVSPGIQLAKVSGNLEIQAQFSITENEIVEAFAESDAATEKEFFEALPPVTFILKNGTEYKHKGKITKRSGVVDSSTGTVSLTAVFPNPERMLISGMQGTVVFPYKVDNVMVVPQSAVVKLQDKSMVYLVGADSCAVGTIVTTMSAASPKDIVILSGIKPGDKIVTEGANNVQDGQKVLFPEEKTEKK